MDPQIEAFFDIHEDGTIELKENLEMFVFEEGGENTATRLIYFESPEP